MWASNAAAVDRLRADTLHACVDLEMHVATPRRTGCDRGSEGVDVGRRVHGRRETRGEHLAELLGRLLAQHEDRRLDPRPSQVDPLLASATHRPAAPERRAWATITGAPWP